MSVYIAPDTYNEMKLKYEYLMYNDFHAFAKKLGDGAK